VLISDVPALRDYWYPICRSDELGVAPRAVRLFGERYVAWRPQADGPPVLSVDECPHRAGRLSQGWVADGCLVCPYHGWHFDDAGACRVIPANDPSVPIPSRARVESSPAGDRYGLVWVCVGDPSRGIPHLAEADDDGFVVIHELMEQWEVSAPRIIDNALDVSHVAWTHRNSVGDSAHPRLADYEVDRDGEQMHLTVRYTARVDERESENTGLPVGLTEIEARATIIEPFVYRGSLDYIANGLRHVMFKFATPVDDQATIFCQIVARNDRPDPSRWESIAATDRLVQSEDRTLLEEVPHDFPLDLTVEVHTRSDRMTIEYRRLLADLAARSVEGVASEGREAVRSLGR
jgi:phenylpropionate dioxygenase-like ring-hydroxylating dioxygenase large terminal subunit